MNFQEATRGMTRRQKLGYLWDYYKLPILLAAAALCLILSVTVHALTRKNVCLSMAFVNVQVSDETLQEMTAPYLDTQPGGPSRNTIQVERSLFSDAGDTSATSEEDGVSYEYSYASQIKLLAMITAKKLDLVIMDQNTTAIFLRQGYIEKSIPLTDTDFFKKAGLKEPVYAGIIRNSERKDAAKAFLTRQGAEE